MKNKILKKIILVVVSITVLVSVLVIPSFAYDGRDIQPSPTFSVHSAGNRYVPTSLSYPDTELFFTGGNDVTYSYNQFDKNEGDYGTLFYNLVNTKTHDYSSPGEYFVPVYKEFYMYADKDVAGNFNNGFNFGTLKFLLEQPFILDLYNPSYSSIFLCLPSANLGDTFDYSVTVSYLYYGDREVRTLTMPLTATVVEDDLNNRGIYLYYLFNNIDRYITYGSLILNIEITPPSGDDFTYLFNSPYEFLNYNGDFVTQRAVKFIFRFNSALYFGERANRFFGDFVFADYGTGEINGWREGYDDGLSEGYDEGYDTGYQTGNTEGYDTGYSVGFGEGYELGSVTTTPFDVIVRAVSGFLSWEFIPGVSISLVTSIFVGATLMIILLKKLAGG